MRPEDATPLEASTTVGQFVVLRPIGRGSMGQVYAAYDERLDRRVALKLLKESSTSGPTAEGRQRVLREAQAMARLSHPNVVQVFEVGEHEGQLFIAMEYVEGETLGDWQSGRPWRQVLEAYLQAGEGLAAAHDAGLTHRDFKPHNVVIEEPTHGTMRARVLDFGIARVGEDAPDVTDGRSRETGTVSRDHKLTATGRLLGTPAYMAPEQFEFAALGSQTDQFAYCVSVWEGLYGERPFRGVTVPELMHAVLPGGARRAAGRRTRPRLDPNGSKQGPERGSGAALSVDEGAAGRGCRSIGRHSVGDGAWSSGASSPLPRRGRRPKHGWKTVPSPVGVRRRKRTRCGGKRSGSGSNPRSWTPSYPTPSRSGSLLRHT